MIIVNILFSAHVSSIIHANTLKGTFIMSVPFSIVYMDGPSIVQLGA